jgi:transcriptional regulator with XRE-family HTH domain
MKTVSGKEIRAARALCGLTREELATMACVTSRTLDRIEADKTANPHPITLKAIRTALESLGVEFIDGGVRLKKAGVER